MSATRRDVLTSGAAAFAGAVLPVAAVVADEPLLALWTRYQEADQRMRAAWESCRTRKDEIAVAEPATRAWEVAIDAIAAAPAATITGLAIKLRLIGRDISGGTLSYGGEEMLASALADAERLAGGVP